MSKVREISRTYIFEHPNEVQVDDVRNIEVSDSGGHRLTCNNGSMIYVRAGWYAIEIESDFGWEM